MRDCYIACVNGLTGLPEAIKTVFPQIQVQLCMVHLVRNSLKYVNSKQRAEAAKDWFPSLESGNKICSASVVQLLIVECGLP